MGHFHITYGRCLHLYRLFNEVAWMEQASGSMLAASGSTPEVVLGGEQPLCA